MTYNADYFIEKFTAIPEDRWITETFSKEINGVKCCCALGHCGDDHGKGTEEGKTLFDLVFHHLPNGERYVAWINDRATKAFPQETPKQRILAALEIIKKKGG